MKKKKKKKKSCQTRFQHFVVFHTYPIQVSSTLMIGFSIDDDCKVNSFCVSLVHQCSFG